MGVVTTLNPTYDELLSLWAAQGCPGTAECEECGGDLSGQDVHDVGWGWVCDHCARHQEPWDADDAHAERRQMGIF